MDDTTRHDHSPHDPAPDRDPAARGTGGLKGWLQGSRRLVAAGVLGVLLVVGVGGTGYAVARATDGDGTSQTSGGDRRDARGDRDGNRGGADEEALTGDVLASVTEAVEAEFPGATIERAETDDDGVYEAHIVTEDDEEVTVELDADFTVTGREGDDA